MIFRPRESCAKGTLRTSSDLHGPAGQAKTPPVDADHTATANVQASACPSADMYGVRT